MEPQWNPMVEAQAVDRVHRKGQTRFVTITRYIVSSSIEAVSYHIRSAKSAVANYRKYIQWVQENKLKLINQSICMETSDSVDGETDRLGVRCIILVAGS